MAVDVSRNHRVSVIGVVAGSPPTSLCIYVVALVSKDLRSNEVENVVVVGCPPGTGASKNVDDYVVSFRRLACPLPVGVDC